MYRALITILLIVIINLCSAQDIVKFEMAKWNGKIDFTLPIPIKNEGFSNIVDGISSAEIGIDRNIFGKFFLGVGFGHRYFEINKFTLNEGVESRVQFFNPYGKLSYFMLLNERVFMEPFLKIGYNIMQYKTDGCNNIQEAYGYNIGATLFLNWENLSYGFTISHHTINNTFNPNLVCYNKFSGYSDSDFSDRYGFISVGFAVNINIGKLEKKAIN